MTLGELILMLASIDNHRNIPQSEMLDWAVTMTDGEANYRFLSFYCDEATERICIDVERY